MNMNMNMKSTRISDRDLARVGVPGWGSDARDAAQGGGEEWGTGLRPRLWERNPLTQQDSEDQVSSGCPLPTPTPAAAGGRGRGEILEEERGEPLTITPTPVRVNY